MPWQPRDLMDFARAATHWLHVQKLGLEVDLQFFKFWSTFAAPCELFEASIENRLSTSFKLNDFLLSCKISSVSDAYKNWFALVQVGSLLMAPKVSIILYRYLTR